MFTRYIQIDYQALDMLYVYVKLSKPEQNAKLALSWTRLLVRSNQSQIVRISFLNDKVNCVNLSTKYSL